MIKIYNLDEQRDMDLMLDPVIIENVYYYDEDEERYCRTKLEIYGYTLVITTFQDNNNIWKKIRNTFNKDLEIDIYYENLKDEFTYVKLNDNDVFQMSNDSFGIFETYFNELNRPFEIERINFSNSINEKVKNLITNKEIMVLIENFIKGNVSSFFYDYKLIAGVEYCINEKDKIGKMLFLTSERLRKSIMFTEKVTKGINTSIYEKIENYEEVNDYLENKLKLLSEILKMKLNTQDFSYVLYLTYRLVYLKSIEYFARVWGELYGDYFLNVDNANLDELVFNYCHIDTINPKRLNNVAPLVYFLMFNKKFETNDNFIDCYDWFVDKLLESLEQKKVLDFERKLNKNQVKTVYTINDIDLMNGHEFESFISLLFNKMGYTSEVTKGSGDQGIDVIAEKNGIKIGIQTKCYSNAITNKAIQEVVAGLKHYNLDKGIVITNNYFTESARELAISNEVVLWDRNILKEKISEVL